MERGVLKEHGRSLGRFFCQPGYERERSTIGLSIRARLDAECIDDFSRNALAGASGSYQEKEPSIIYYASGLEIPGRDRGFSTPLADHHRGSTRAIPDDACLRRDGHAESRRASFAVRLAVAGAFGEHRAHSRAASACSPRSAARAARLRRVRWP